MSDKYPEVRFFTEADEPQISLTLGPKSGIVWLFSPREARLLRDRLTSALDHWEAMRAEFHEKLHEEPLPVEAPGPAREGGEA